MIRVLLQRERPQDLDWLAPGELERATAMVVARRREDFLLGRWTAKRLISSVLHCAPGPAIEVRAAPSGRPAAFFHGQRLRLSLSISHRESLALAAVDETGGPVGADLEVVEPRSEAFVRDYFTAIERASVAAGDRDLLANVIWSAKESALKALGVGLTVDTRSVEVELASGPTGVWAPLLMRGAFEGKGWWRREGATIVTVVGRSGREPQLLQPAPRRQSTFARC